MSSASAVANLHLLSRNPIFTASKNVWGYEIQTAASLIADSEPVSGSMDVGMAVIGGDYVGLRSILSRNKKLLLAYTRDQITNQIPDALPAHSSVVLVSVRDQQDTTLLPALCQMAASGHGIALDWDPKITPTAPARDCATLVCAGPSAQAGDSILSAFIASGTPCIGRDISTREEFEALRELGVTLFQGRYFKTAEIIPGKKLSSHQNSRLRIMHLIEEPEPNTDALAQAIQSDVSLSYRLMAYLNSPAFGFARKIDSIRQALNLLGWKNLRTWLRAVLLADMTQGEQQTELLHLSLRRGKFMELIVSRYDYWNFEPDEMFLLGMFSLLDAILGVPMADVLNFLPLNDAQKKALKGVENCEYTPLFSLMRAVEDREEVALNRLLQDLSLDRVTTDSLDHEASAWASSVLEASPVTEN